MRLEQVVPWGRTLGEYLRMFDLNVSALSRLRILGVGDGPASFNVEANELGAHIISCDPIYAFAAEQIRARVRATHDRLVAAAREHQDLFTWQHLTSPEHMGQVRLAAMEKFLLDLPAGSREGRYVPAALPHLPFSGGEFSLALCSHLLFLYSEQLSLEFHVSSVIEMARVAREVRIFPLLMLGNPSSPHLAPLREELSRRGGYEHEVRAVPYEFQKGANQMLVVRARF